MNFFAKHRLAIVTLALVSLSAVPFAGAQTTEIQRILGLNTGGSYLGIQMDDVTSSNMSRYKLSEERGAIVRSVIKSSPAEDAGIKEDDVLLEFEGFQVWSASQLSRLVQETPPGRKINLVLSRDGKKMNLSVKIGQREGRRAELRLENIPEPNGRSFRLEIPPPFSPRAPEPADRKPRLGVTLQPLTDQMGEFLGIPGRKGALVVSVAGGSASAGKLKAGDVIIGAQGKSINDPEELTRIVRDRDQGNLSLKVIRDKKEIPVVINLPAEESEGKGLRL